MNRLALGALLVLSVASVACGSSDGSPASGTAGSSNSAGSGSSGNGSSGSSNGSSGSSNGSSGSSNGSAGNGSSGSGSSGSGGSNSGGGGGVLVHPTAGPLTGTPGVWEDVTPEGINLSTDYGAQDVLADPASPGVFYAFACYQGVYRSVDWGATWTHVSKDGNIEKGRPWGEAVAPDGSYMLASNGYGVNEGAWKSIDNGETWRAYSISSDNDPYNFDIDPSNPQHALVAMHASEHIYESMDGGETWQDKGPSGAGGSNYVFFITSTTWIAISQDGNGSGTRRTLDSGKTWAQVGPMEHAHGNAQIFIDTNGDVYVGGHGQGAVFRSTDNAATFTAVSGQRATTVFATDKYIYATDPGANAAGTDPVPQMATRADGTDWKSFDVPSAMTNGAKRAATMQDPDTGKWVIVSGNWNGGFWRYIEE